MAAAGNAGDLYDAEGSPGNATRVVSVANSVDAYSQIDTLHATVNGAPQSYGAQRSADYAWASKPDLSGSVVRLMDTSNLDGCDPITRVSPSFGGRIAQRLRRPVPSWSVSRGRWG